MIEIEEAIKTGKCPNCGHLLKNHTKRECEWIDGTVIFCDTEEKGDFQGDDYECACQIKPNSPLARAMKLVKK